MPRKLKPCKGCGGPKPKGSGILYCKECSALCPTHGVVRHRPSKPDSCKDCVAAYMRVWLSADPSRVTKNARRVRAKQYGITVAELEMYEAVDECEICGPTESRLCIDHDHDSGKIRGVICNNCNVSLGHAGDDPKKLRALADYLETKQEELY